MNSKKIQKKLQIIEIQVVNSVKKKNTNCVLHRYSAGQQTSQEKKNIKNS